MSGINRVVIVGHLTRDPELRYTQSEQAVCEFSIAVNSREKDGSGEWQDRADFFDVTVWGNQAESCAQNLAKGKLTGVEGRLRQDRWKSKDTNENRSKVKIVATNVQFLGARDGQPSAEPSDSDFGGPPTDDIPF